MKIALCLSGQMRKWKQCFPSIKRTILDPHKPDVFLSTWEYGVYQASVGVGYNDGSLAELKDAYNPLLLKLHRKEDEKHILYSLYNNVDDLRPRACVSCNVERFLLGSHKVFDCQQAVNYYRLYTSVKYDCVIRCRFDLEIDDVIPIHTSGIAIPFGNDWKGGYNDQIAWGGFDEMKVYSDLHRNITKYANQGVEVHPETMLKYHLDSWNIPIARAEVSHRIIR